MSTALLAFLVLAGVALAWLARQGLATRPWLETGPLDDAPARGASALPAATLGLGMFMAVAVMLMALLLSAAAMRMELADWSPPPRPGLLWANTAVLAVASIALHRATRGAGRGDRDATARLLLLGGAAGVLFVLGQMLAWRQLARDGYLPANNPADAFFYLITAVHGLHLLGGLVALARTGARLRRTPLDRLRLSVGLCATYWHFLLVVWVVLFAALAFSPSFDGFLALCLTPFR